MTSVARVGNFILGIVMILMGLGLFVDPDGGLPIIAFIVSISFTLRGIRTLVYYFNMARYMVGGRTTLYVGMIFLDLGLLTGAMTDRAQIYIMMYLAGLHLFSGLVGILRGREAKHYRSPVWRNRIFYGIVNILIAIAALAGGIFLKSIEIVMYVYGAGLVYAGGAHIGSAFRKTAIVYIQ